MTGLIVLVKLVSPRGPVFFRQERVGFRGRTFMCYKFRSMKPDADTIVHQQYFAHLLKSGRPMTKMDDRGDPRLIPLGWLLRASGLDELPQIINVIKGEMSLVGPRPCTVNEFKHYLAWQRERFNTLPGLTGLWQVKGKNKTTFVQMIQLDIEYARRKTLSMDMEIMARTFRVLWDQTRQAARWGAEPGAERLERGAEWSQEERSAERRSAPPTG